jgi:hypothetical protein
VTDSKIVSLASIPQPGGTGRSLYVPRDRVAQLYPQTPGSLSVASYESQGYGGGILTGLHMGKFKHYRVLFNHDLFHEFSYREGNQKMCLQTYIKALKYSKQNNVFLNQFYFCVSIW